MTATVNIAELSPETLAEPQGSTSIVPIELETVAPSVGKLNTHSTTGPLSLNEPVGQAAVMSTSIVLSEPSPQLANLDRARQMLAECRTLSEVKKIRDIAEAARTYAKAAHLGRESQNYAAEISLEASRRAGEILKQLEKDTPQQSGAKKGAASVAGPSEFAQTLMDTATPERTARHWQSLAAIPGETLEKYIISVHKNAAEISAAGLLKFHKNHVALNKTSPSKKDYFKPNSLSPAQITADLTEIRLRLADYINSLQQSLDRQAQVEIKTLLRTLRELSRDADRLEVGLKAVETEVAA